MRLAIPAATPEGAQSFQDHVFAVQAARGRSNLAADQVDHEAVAQAARGDLHLVDAQPAHDAVENGGPGVHDVDARFVDAQLAALLCRRVAQPIEHVLHLIV